MFCCGQPLDISNIQSRSIRKLFLNASRQVGMQFARSIYALRKGLLIMEVIISFALLGFLAINLVGAFLIVRDRQADWQSQKEVNVKHRSQALTS